MVNDEVKLARAKAKKVGYMTHMFNEFKKEWDSSEKVKTNILGFFVYGFLTFLFFCSIFYGIRSMTFCEQNLEAVINNVPYYYSADEPYFEAVDNWNVEISKINAQQLGMGIEVNKQEFLCHYDFRRGWNRWMEVLK